MKSVQYEKNMLKWFGYTERINKWGNRRRKLRKSWLGGFDEILKKEEGEKFREDRQTSMQTLWKQEQDRKIPKDVMHGIGVTDF